MSALSYAGCSDVGRRRDRNQDRWGLDEDQGLFMVADGVASSSDGALAAQMAIDLLPGYVGRHLDTGQSEQPSASERLGRAVAELSDDLYARGRTDARLAGATTTLVAAVITESQATIAHLGDSRAYLYRDQLLHRLTADHSLLRVLIDTGTVEAADAAAHPARGVITRHVAMKPPALPDASVVTLMPGDRLLLCSDGLHGVLTDTVLGQILDSRSDPNEACTALIAAANDAGGPDNITAVVIDHPGAPTPLSPRA